MHFKKEIQKLHPVLRLFSTSLYACLLFHVSSASTEVNLTVREGIALTSIKKKNPLA